MPNSAVDKGRKDSFTGITAREYMHKRFRSRGGADKSSSSSPQAATIDATPPHIVTPPRLPAVSTSTKHTNSPGLMQREIVFPGSGGGDNQNNIDLSSTTPSGGSDMVSPKRRSSGKSSKLPKSSPENYIHKPTASHGGLTSSPLAAPADPVRYSLSKGKQHHSTTSASASTDAVHPSTNGHRRASDGAKLKSAHSLALANASSSSERRPSDSNKLSSSKLSSSKLRKQDPHAYKIFLLLLQPQTKIFELIQLIYSPNDTTIGTIIQMIPENATEPALGAQAYVGLCRPKTQEELLEQDLLASEARPGIESANITLGEILVAIPQGFTGRDVAILSKQILANPKIVKLLKRADPLAPKRKRSSRHKHHGHRSSTRRSSSKEHVHVLEKHDEADEDQEQMNQRMKQAMQHAAAEAETANAAIPGDYKIPRSNSITNSIDDSQAESLDESYSSWSKSFDASFSAQSSICSGVSRRAHRRRERQSKRMRILKRSAVGAFGVMIAFYALDTRSTKATLADDTDTVTQTPMGFMGIFQCLFLLLTLYKVERWVRRSPGMGDGGIGNTTYGDDERRCPFLKASHAAMQRFKSRYAKKLKKPLIANTKTLTDDDSSLSQRLRSFSLKAAAVHRDANDTDTGSI